MSDPLSSQARMERSLVQQVHGHGRCLFKVAFDVLRDAAAQGQRQPATRNANPVPEKQLLGGVP